MARMTAIRITETDRDRLNSLADTLTRSGLGGKFGQAETIRYLLDQRDQAIDAEEDDQ